MIDSDALDRLFRPYQKQLAEAAYRGLGRAGQLVALSVQADLERPGEVLNLLAAENRTVTIMRRDAIVAELRTLLAGDDAVTFRKEKSWVNVLFADGDYRVRMRLKTFQGDNGEQHMAHTQLCLDVGGDPTMHDVTLGWNETDQGLVPYVVHVNAYGDQTWRMDLPQPVFVPDTTATPLPSAAGAESVRRVRRVTDRPAARPDDEISDSA